MSRHLPHFRLRMSDGTPADPTLNQLMAHTAGLDCRFQQPVDGPFARARVSDGLDQEVATLSENLERIASVPLDRAPGSGWRYSVATDVLGGVVEAVTGQSLDAAIRTLVTDPLGIDAGFRWPDGDLAAAYFDARPTPRRMTGPTEVPLPLIDGAGLRFDPGRIAAETAWPSGGAGMTGRARDALTLLEAFRTGDFLPEQWREAARMPQIGVEAQAQGPGWGYSWLGAVLIDPAAADSRLSAGSVSWGGAYGHCWAIDFARRRTVISLTNTAFEGMIGRFAREIVAAAVTGA